MIFAAPPLLLIGGFVVDLRSKHGEASAAEQEVSGQVDVPVVAAEGLLADLSVETHLHQLLDLVFLSNLLREVLRPGLRRVLKHLSVVLEHTRHLCILGVVCTRVSLRAYRAQERRGGLAKRLGRYEWSALASTHF